jgi:Zn-dependent protease/CBS domain-containing protein
MAPPTQTAWDFKRPREQGDEQQYGRRPGPANSGHSAWSWRVGQIAGIDLYMHATFVMLLGWVAVGHLVQGHRLVDALAGVALILSVFTVVVLHELGHALVAKRFGIRTRDIMLLPIGGVARMDRMPDDPKQELLVAIAGPAVNVALAMILFGVVAAMSIPFGIYGLHLIGGPFLTKLMWINIGLAVFNMIPAFPMDGGRLLRALLAMRMAHVQATDLAAKIGRGLALALGFAGLFFNPMLVLIALFIWIGGQQEARSEHVRSSLGGLTVRDAMITRFRQLTPTETVAHTVEHALEGFQHDFPVVENGRVVGVLTRADVLRVIASDTTGQLVGDCMRREFAVAEDTEALTSAMQRFDLATCPAVPVLRGDRLAGILTAERIAELLVLHEAAANHPATFVVRG